MIDTPKTPHQWAIVELMGHTRIAGAVSEVQWAGGIVARVHIPEVSQRTDTTRNGGPAVDVRRIPAHTRYLTHQAIYAVNWVDEETALAAAHLFAHEPVSPYSLARAIDRMDDGCLQRMLQSMQPAEPGAPARGAGA
jgi:hypothetical protein